MTVVTLRYAKTDVHVSDYWWLAQGDDWNLAVGAACADAENLDVRLIMDLPPGPHVITGHHFMVEVFIPSGVHHLTIRHCQFTALRGETVPHQAWNPSCRLRVGGSP